MVGDHPRMCGDHALSLSLFCFLWGSPPHVRGPQLLEYLLYSYLGITPACAGTTRH